VSGLRKLVGDGRLETRSGGYLLRVEPGELDLERFEALVVEAGTVPASAARKLLTEALSLWRGEPLLDLGSSEFGRVEIARLDAERLEAIQERIEAELRLGLHGELIPELQRLAVAHPDRERLRGQLMLALYRSGRQTEALESYRVHRQALVRELGLEPGRPLQQLEQQILRQDPTLDPPAAPLSIRPDHRRLVRVMGAAVGLAAAAAVAFFMVGGNAGTAATAVIANSVAAIDPHSNRVIADIQVGGGPSWIAAGAGSVWVLNERDQTISQIDPRRHRLVRTFAVSAATPFALTVAEGSLWVADGRSKSLLRLDPQGVVVERTPLFSRRFLRLIKHTQGIGGSIWLALGPTNGVERFDPTTGAHTLVNIGSSATTLSAVAVGGGSVWAADIGTNQLWQIDPGQAAAIRAIPVGQDPLGVAFGAGSVWVANAADGTVSRIDPQQGKATATISLGQTTPSQLALANGLIWTTVG
jgi:DNA-binding SARP family transcriptional activator/streptogramin lyase